MSRTSKKIVAAFALALMAGLGTAAPADAAAAGPNLRIGDGWCC